MTTRLLRLPAVIEMTGMGRDSIYRLAREGRFPRQRKITERSSAWREDEILEWINSRPTAQLGTADACGVAIGDTNTEPDDSQRKKPARRRSAKTSVYSSGRGGRS